MNQQYGGGHGGSYEPGPRGGGYGPQGPGYGYGPGPSGPPSGPSQGYPQQGYPQGPPQQGFPQGYGPGPGPQQGQGYGPGPGFVQGYGPGPQGPFPGGPQGPAAGFSGLSGLGQQRKVLWFVALGAAIVVVLGSMLPWITISSVLGSRSMSGLHGDGWITLFFGVVAIAALVVTITVRQPWVRFVPWAAVAAGVLALLVALYDLMNVSTVDTGIIIDASVGYGLVLTLLSALVLAVSAGLLAGRR